MPLHLECPVQHRSYDKSWKLKVEQLQRCWLKRHIKMLLQRLMERMVLWVWLFLILWQRRANSSLTGIFLFHPAIPNYPNACVFLLINSSLVLKSLQPLSRRCVVQRDLSRYVLSFTRIHVFPGLSDSTWSRSRFLQNTVRNWVELQELAQYYLPSSNHGFYHVFCLVWHVLRSHHAQ